MTAARPDFAIQTESANERVAAIVDAMVSGRWERGQTAGEIAERFGVKTTAVSREAVIVGKAVDYIFGDRDRLEREIRSELRTIRQEAARVYRVALEESEKPELQAANGALNAATKALDSIARNAGIGNKPDVQNNVQVNFGTGDGDLAAMLLNLSPDELAVVARDDVWSALVRQVKAYRSGIVETEGVER